MGLVEGGVNGAVGHVEDFISLAFGLVRKFRYRGRSVLEECDGDVGLPALCHTFERIRVDELLELRLRANDGDGREVELVGDGGGDGVFHGCHIGGIRFKYDVAAGNNRLNIAKSDALKDAA